MPPANVINSKKETKTYSQLTHIITTSSPQSFNIIAYSGVLVLNI